MVVLVVELNGTIEYFNTRAITKCDLRQRSGYKRHLRRDCVAFPFPAKGVSPPVVLLPRKHDIVVLPRLH